MPFSKIFPRVLIACSVLGLFVATASAQTDITRPRQVTHATLVTETEGIPRLETDPMIVSLAPAEEVVSTARRAVSPRQHLDQLMLAAIDARLGAPYLYGATGPHRFDCSGFVWSVFQSAGINFERSSARALWTRLAPASKEEAMEFGTLVFFNNLKHVGIVADEHGFYHASQSQGVVYSPFNGYWSERIDGFRRLPLPKQMLASAR